MSARGITTPIVSLPKLHQKSFWDTMGIVSPMISTTMDFKDEWDLDSALKVVQNKTVDSKLWAEAVEWLLLYGPPEIVSILLQASGHATEQVFPELEAAGFTSDGIPVYDVVRLAKTLGMPEEEVRKIIEEKQSANKLTHFIYDGSSETVH